MTSRRLFSSRLLPLTMFIAAFPALGQVENGAARRSAAGAPVHAPDLDAPARSIREIRAPRLLAGEPSVGALEALSFSDRSVAPSSPTSSAPGGMSAMAAVPQARDSGASGPSVPDRMPQAIALLAIPTNAGPPATRTVSAASAAEFGAASVDDFVRRYWPYATLGGGVLLGLGLLFWGLGERSRRREVALSDRLGEPAFPQDVPLLGAAQADALIDELLLVESSLPGEGKSAVPLPALADAAQAGAPEPALPPAEARAEAPQCATLRDALVAMKQDLAMARSLPKTALNA